MAGIENVPGVSFLPFFLFLSLLLWRGMGRARQRKLICAAGCGYEDEDAFVLVLLMHACLPPD
jgi:hypothetical protein